jgi:hypothetical protein
MKLICPSCTKEVGDVTAVAKLILTVHCPYDGCDFGVAVEPPAPVADAPAAAPAAAPAT